MTTCMFGAAQRISSFQEHALMTCRIDLVPLDVAALAMDTTPRTFREQLIYTNPRRYVLTANLPTCLGTPLPPEKVHFPMTYPQHKTPESYARNEGQVGECAAQFGIPTRNIHIPCSLHSHGFARSPGCDTSAPPCLVSNLSTRSRTMRRLRPPAPRIPISTSTRTTSNVLADLL